MKTEEECSRSNVDPSTTSQSSSSLSLLLIRSKKGEEDPAGGVQINLLFYLYYQLDV